MVSFGLMTCLNTYFTTYWTNSTVYVARHVCCHVFGHVCPTCCHIFQPAHYTRSSRLITDHCINQYCLLFDQVVVIDYFLTNQQLWAVMSEKSTKLHLNWSFRTIDFALIYCNVIGLKLQAWSVAFHSKNHYNWVTIVYLKVLN